jgi:hypothetical protein
MRNRHRGLGSGCWGGLLLVLAGCSGGQTGDESTPREPMQDSGTQRDAGGRDDFFDSIRGGFGNADYEPADSIGQLAEWSDQVAVGTIASLRPGRESIRGGTTSTVLVELAIDEVFKGEPASALWLELYVGAVFDAALLPDPLPENRLLVFVLPAPADDPAAPDVPGDAPLYVPTTPQGMIVEADDGSAEESDPSAPLFPDSFDAAIDAVRDALR